MSVNPVALHRRFDGRVAIVTGAGSGIGRATALALGAEGAIVVCLDRDALAVGDTATTLRASGTSALDIVVDVTNADAIQAAFAHGAEAFGGLHILVNNAGYAIAGDVLETDDDALDRVLAVSLKGVFYGCRAAIPLMLASGGGAIVNVASAAAIKAVTRRAAYIAAKAGVIGLTKSIALDFMGRGIRCNCVAPGTVDSPWIASILAGESDPVAARQRMVDRQPLGRLGKPEEIAAAILYLASEESSFAHGTCLVVDGGFTVG